MEPNLKYPFNTRSFFTSKNKKDIKAGLELWQGYFQSLRPSQDKMYVNIDISTGVMYKPIKLVSLCLEFFRRDNPGDLANIPDRERVRLQRFISNVRVETTYGRKRVLVIKKLSRESARTLMFSTRDGTSMSVETYFKSLNVALRYPLLPCIEVFVLYSFALEC
jgi:eukaryotic translation initiation factor 2C